MPPHCRHALFALARHADALPRRFIGACCQRMLPARPCRAMMRAPLWRRRASACAARVLKRAPQRYAPLRHSALMAPRCAPAQTQAPICAAAQSSRDATAAAAQRDGEARRLLLPVTAFAAKRQYGLRCRRHVRPRTPRTRRQRHDASRLMPRYAAAAYAMFTLRLPRWP
jgi:hypothetical protein